MSLAAPTNISSGLSKSDRAFNFLMGEIMKKTQGRANPHLVRQILQEKLDALLPITVESS